MKTHIHSLSIEIEYSIGTPEKDVYRNLKSLVSSLLPDQKIVEMGVEDGTKDTNEEAGTVSYSFYVMLG